MFDVSDIFYLFIGCVLVTIIIGLYEQKPKIIYKCLGQPYDKALKTNCCNKTCHNDILSPFPVVVDCSICCNSGFEPICECHEVWRESKPICICRFTPEKLKI